MTLSYREDAVERFGVGAMALSASLPVRPERYSPSEVAPFLEGLLPDGWARGGLERRFGVHRVDSFSLLVALGRECAGAVSLVPAGDPSPAADAGAVTTVALLDEAEIARRLAALETDPFGVDDDSRITLAGTPWKLPLVRTAEGGWAAPGRGRWSTHLVRPESPDLVGLVATEAFALAALRAGGVRVVDAEMTTFADRPALVVARFDRRPGPDGRTVRIHQEDGCQALGAPRAERAEHDGGPSLAELADLVGDMTSNPEAELTHLVRWVASSLVFGKVDGTARDLSLVYADDECRIAPIASMAGTADYPERPRRLGLAVGGVDDLDHVGRTELLAEAGTWGMPLEVVATVLADLIEDLGSALDAARSVVDPGDEVVAACRTRLERLASS
jgi:serine/threonine-protein kinase HipA